MDIYKRKSDQNLEIQVRFSFALKQVLLTSNDCTHWASVCASTAVCTSVWIDNIDVTL